MKKICILCVICGFLSGCAAAPQGDFRRTRVVADENIRLKKQAADAERKMDGLNKRMDALTKDRDQLLDKLKQADSRHTDLQKQYYDLEQNLNAALQDCQTALQSTATAADTAQPAVSCEELEKQYSQMFTDLMRQLLECSQKLEQYEQNAASE